MHLLLLGKLDVLHALLDTLVITVVLVCQVPQQRHTGSRHVISVDMEPMHPILKPHVNFAIKVLTVFQVIRVFSAWPDLISL